MIKTMSFLKDIQSRKGNLNTTKTTITEVNGVKYTTDIRNNEEITNEETTYGFVVDMKPDNIPCEVCPGLYLGSQDCADDSVLVEYGIRRVLSVGVEANVSCATVEFIPCLDLPETDLTSTLRRGVSFICSALDANDRVLVHCNAGVSRSAAVVIAYLISVQSYTHQAAYDLVKSKRPAVQPNAGFVRQLKNLLI